MDDMRGRLPVDARGKGADADGAAGGATKKATVGKRNASTAIDSVWTHGIPFGSGFKCHYCNRAFSGGGATRFKEHLAGIIGNVEACQKVPKDVRKCMEESRTEGKRARAVNKARKKRIDDEIARSVGVEDVVTINDYGDDIPNDEEGQLQFVLKRSIHETNIRNVATCSRSGGGSQRRIDTMFQKQSASKRRVGFDIDLACSRAPVQPRINVALNPDLKDKLGRAWSKFFQANSVAGRKANCPYFRAAFKLTQQLGEGVPCPTGESIDGSYLESNFEELEHDMKQCQMDWDQYKVTLMCNSWTGQNGESIINFMIYCNEKLFFHRTINATGETQNASFLYDCIRKVIVGDIGIDRVMQIVTDNGSNYKKACAQVTREFPKIFWQPCAAHTINLLLKSIGKFTDVERVISSAQRICKFFYNHNNLRAEMKRNIGGELYRWNATRFGTVFIFLQSFWDRKDKFRQWMASEEWANSRYNGDAEFTEDWYCLGVHTTGDNL
ncbi:uncharacterized protein [Miscanthus floridulus]|uniref:uncharacterized protein n=1 Tax=Miscanthus floridulus TaxID=154761 RepID=UPI0034592BDD